MARNAVLPSGVVRPPRTQVCAPSSSATDAAAINHTPSNSVATTSPVQRVVESYELPAALATDGGTGCHGALTS